MAASQDIPTRFLTLLEDLSQYLKVQRELGNQEIVLSQRSKKTIDSWTGSAWQNQRFIGRGPLDAKLMIVDSEASFFEGPSGQLLVKILSAMHLRTEQVYICNAADPEQIGYHVKTHGTQFIVTLGENAYRALVDKKKNLKEVRGCFIPFNGIRLMATHHPKALIKNPVLKREVWDDMKQVMSEAGL
ncbi:MAG: uracil-DNA glycosylase [Desulfobacter sp.]|nr:uracil-DNA glycosylase [Desulfobacter sp.]WDP86586.1 MAG: uracil-DNA glycosylase [Desulfobacter sp.]